MTERDPLESYRPSLVKLTTDLEEMETELRTGFTDRPAVLDWLQRLTVRTLGELPQQWFHEIARQFRPLDAVGERTLLAAMLRDDCRERALAPATARELRERVAATAIKPALHRAFRQLRTDAGEYVADARDSTHDPLVQRHIAMRPALDELEANQQQALSQCLDGFAQRGDILDWGNVVELATHGEITPSFTARCYRERSTAQMLLGDDRASEHARELFAAVHLLPAFNAGIRDLHGRTGEVPDADHPNAEIPIA